MQLGFVGFGRMGYSMVLRLLEKDHGVFVYDRAPDQMSSLVRFGDVRSGSLVDVVVDGGNSNYTDTVRRGDALQKKGTFFVDCGTSGGLLGAKKAIASRL